jgi:hypothetical protein
MGLKHDPEKRVPVFPRTNAKRYPKIMLKQKIEQDDDSKKSHPAPGPVYKVA